MVCIVRSTTGLDFKSTLFDKDIDIYGNAKVNDTVIQNGYTAKVIHRNQTHITAQLIFIANHCQNGHTIVCTNFADNTYDACVIEYTSKCFLM